MKKLAYIFIVLSLITCKKDKLIDDKAVLIGKWEWSYSRFERSGSNAFTYSRTPNSVGATYQLNFLEKGKVQFMKDNVILEEYRIVIKRTGVEWCFHWDQGYVIWPNNKSDNSLIICIKDDILRTNSFPFNQDDVSDFIEGNYFIRE
jgi:hypothetical protein